MRKAQQKPVGLLWQKAEVQSKQLLELMAMGFVCAVPIGRIMAQYLS